jgi:hypothetical protein
MRPTTKDPAMKKLSIAADLLAAPAALAIADLAAIEGGADKPSPEEINKANRPAGVDSEEEWQAWLKKHPQDPNGKAHQASPSQPTSSSGSSLA